MKVPLLDLRIQYQNIKDEIDAKMQKVVTSQQFILGHEVEALEREMAEFIQTDDAAGVSSGSDALIVSLMALGIGSGDKVVTTPFTFFATAGAIARVGAQPVFCDIEPESFSLDPDKLASLLQESAGQRNHSRIKAVLPVHLYGQTCDMDPIMEASRSRGLSVIEDACQSVGSEYPSRSGVRKSGTIGDLGTLSFFPSKNLGGFGDGGMVLINRSELGSRIRGLRNHGESTRYFYEEVGGNFRLDALQAAVLRVKLKHLNEWQKGRRERADYYQSLFSEAGLIDDGFIRIPKEIYRDSGIKEYHTYHQYVIRAFNRDKLQKHLTENGIGTSIYYPRPLHLQKCFAYLGYSKGDFPQSEKAAREVLALPVFPELQDGQQQYIVDKIREFYSGS